MLSSTINRIIINTGNLLSFKEFKKKATQSPSEEVFDSVSNTFNAFVSGNQGEMANDSTTLMCTNKAHIKVDKDERVNLKVTVKIFLDGFRSEDLIASIDQAMKELGLSVIDSLILSFPPLPAEEKFTLDHIKPLWIELEKLVGDSKVLTIGVSDLDATELKELYNWSQVKPSTNHVYLDSCCVMPPEMTAFAHDNDIQLLTHNDPKVIFSRERLQKVLETAVPLSESWKMSWLVRYSVLVKCRGIIQNKGFLLCAVKET